MSDGNGLWRKRAAVATVTTASIVLAGFLWPRVVGIVRAVDNLAWLDRHRVEYPEIMSDYRHSRQQVTAAFAAASVDRADIRSIVGKVAENQAQMDGKLSIMSEMLYEVLKLKRQEMGLSVPKRLTASGTPNP